MRELGLTLLLLTFSNVFMTFAWYAHLKELSAKPWIIAALASWGVALFEYLLQVPANRSATVMSLGARILGRDHARRVRAVRVLYMKEPLKLDYLWAA